MTVKDIFQNLWYKQKISQREFTSILGYTAQSSISTPLSRDNGMGMRVESIIRWANALGYQVVLQPKDHIIESDEYLLDGTPQTDTILTNKRGRPSKNSAKNKKAAEEPQPSKILLEIPQPEKFTSPPVAERLPNGNWLIHLSPASSNDQQVDNIVDRYSK